MIRVNNTIHKYVQIQIQILTPHHQQAASESCDSQKKISNHI